MEKLIKEICSFNDKLTSTENEYVMKVQERLKEYESTGLSPQQLRSLHKITWIDVGDTVWAITQYSKLSDSEIIECIVNRKTVKKRVTFSVSGRYINGNFYNGTFTESSIGKMYSQLSKKQRVNVMREIEDVNRGDDMNEKCTVNSLKEIRETSMAFVPAPTEEDIIGAFGAELELYQIDYLKMAAQIEELCTIATSFYDEPKRESISSLKKQIKNCKNPMELKTLNRKLNQLYKDRKKKHV